MEAAIDKCCDLKNLEDNWGQIIHVADTYALGQPKRCLKIITGKIFQPNPNISLKAITLLDSCVKNAGNAFAREMSSRDFVSSFKKGYPKLQTKPRMKLIELLRTWSNEYKANPEFSLLVGIYQWIQREYPSNIREYETAQNIEKRMKDREAYRNLQAQEEEDLAKAIALSLSESQPTSSQSKPLHQQVQSSSTFAYPVSQITGSTTGAATNGQKDLGLVRALFDFEAAEDNEITFKEGEMITLLDVSDQNWWKGSIRGIEGLFPAQFVTRDLGDANKETKVPSEVEADQSRASSSQKKAVKIDPVLVENCLEMLGDADTTGVSRPDPEDLPIMEAQCKAMEPLIEAELEGVYTRISEVDVLKQRLSESLAQYHEMVSVRGYAVMPQQAQYAYMKPGNVPPNAYPPAVMYQPGVPPPPQQQPTTTTMYQPAHVPPPMAAPGLVPGIAPSSNGVPGVPPPAVYGYPPTQPVYPYPYDPNAPWQHQQQPPAQVGAPPVQPQQEMPHPTLFGQPPTDPANVS